MALSKDLVAASATPLILSILSDGESYGYAIIKRVHELSGGQIQWSDGMLYPVLHRLEKQIKQLTTRMCPLMKLLVFVLMTVVFRAAFHIPVPGFRPMNIQQYVVQASIYTKFLWSVFLPVILVMVLIYLSKPKLHEVE